MTLIEMSGEIPVKKNRQRISRYGGIYKDQHVREFEESLAWLCKIAKTEKVIGNFSISGTIKIKENKDLDGALTTILDALQGCGVIENDKYLRKITALQKIVSKEEGFKLVLMPIPEVMHN